MLFEVPGLSLGEPKSLDNKNDSKKFKKDLRSSRDIKNHERNSSHFKNDKKSNRSTVHANVAKPQSNSGMQRQVNEPIISADLNNGKSKLQIKMEQKLRGARFRYLNQKLYQSHSRDALNHFKDHPEDFEKVLLGSIHSDFI